MSLLATLAPFFPDRRAASPEAERIDVILDNWPVHVHPDVLVARAAHDPLGVFPSWQWAGHASWASRAPGWGCPPAHPTDAVADGCVVAPLD